jgi:hypothetical protein
MRAQIRESDLSAFVALGEKLSKSAWNGAFQIMRTHCPRVLSDSTHEEAVICVMEYAAAALEFAASMRRKRAPSSAEDAQVKASNERPSLFIDGYFTRRAEAGDRPSYGSPESRLPAT